MEGIIFSLTFAGEIGEQGQEKEIQPKNEYIYKSTKYKGRNSKVFNFKKRQISALVSSNRKVFEILYLFQSVNWITCFYYLF